MIEDLHHIQLAMPAGCEAAAIHFYETVLGLAHVQKPAALARRGGAWFERGEVRVHLGIETPFRPATKAHPAFRVTSILKVIQRLESAGITCSDGSELPGISRVFTSDPFGNRIELLEVNEPEQPVPDRHS
jgi:catechol 2,3-dioxygenase-like lactoylglutathione lyase family enzyme